MARRLDRLGPQSCHAQGTRLPVVRIGKLLRFRNEDVEAFIRGQCRKNGKILAVKQFTDFGGQVGRGRKLLRTGWISLDKRYNHIAGSPTGIPARATSATGITLPPTFPPPRFKTKDDLPTKSAAESKWLKSETGRSRPNMKWRPFPLRHSRALSRRGSFLHVNPAGNLVPEKDSSIYTTRWNCDREPAPGRYRPG